MKNITNGLVNLSQNETNHIYGGSHNNKTSSIVNTVLDSSIAFFITDYALSKNSNSAIPIVIPMVISMFSGCNKNSTTCDNNTHKAVADLSSTVAVAIKYFLPKHAHRHL